MRTEQQTSILRSTNTLKVLAFLAENSGRDFTAGELLQNIMISKAGIYLALAELLKLDLINRAQRGKFTLYSVKYADPFIKQFKVLQNITLFRPLISRLGPLAKRIVLFGSTGRGEDRKDSDIDLFILATNPAAVNKAVSALKFSRKIQAIVKTPAEFSDMKDTNGVFVNEIERGIALWEDKI
ncbi:MAG: nucleotidyltransferase domain-containing protein [Chloroflexi bacterium]|jgi:predicted nucleotidyltransferase|nr:nucleotidyltransferase domain-containing protein [Chloroflexota bacterium]